jgi:hypothetical protein
MEKYGFNKVYQLGKNVIYDGNADFIMLVWHESQILPAEQYRKAHYPGQTVDIAVCHDPNEQKSQLGAKAIIYHF